MRIFWFSKLRIILIFFLRYYKNSVDQKPGWNRETIEWCKHEAERQKLKEQDYWGALVFDEIKIQVNTNASGSLKFIEFIEIKSRYI